MDSGSPARAVGNSGRVVISAGRRGVGQTSWHELGKRTGPSESPICYCKTGEPHGLYDIRQLLQFADSQTVPRPPLTPVILGQPQALSDLMAGLAAAPAAEGADRG